MQVLEKTAAAQPPSGQTPPDPSLAGKVGTLKLLSSKATWAIIAVNFVNHWGYFIYLNWMPSYFVEALGVNLRKSSFLSFLPWTVMALGSTSAGQLQSIPEKKRQEQKRKAFAFWCQFVRSQELQRAAQVLHSSMLVFA